MEYPKALSTPTKTPYGFAEESKFTEMSLQQSPLAAILLVGKNVGKSSCVGCNVFVGVKVGANVWVGACEGMTVGSSSTVPGLSVVGGNVRQLSVEMSALVELFLWG
jgi:hypothetical protein